MKSKRYAEVDTRRCTACGECVFSCRKNAVEIRNGCFAYVYEDRCVGCGLCGKNCPSGCIEVIEKEELDRA